MGVPAPNFTLVDAISGNPISLSGCAGKIVVIDFFATWCMPCRQAIDSELVPLYNQYYANNPNVVFLSIDIWEPSITRQQLIQFADEHNIGWPILMGSNSNIDRDYNIEGVPTLYVVDGNGIIRWCHVGATPGLGEALRSQIESLLGSSTGGDRGGGVDWRILTVVIVIIVIVVVATLIVLRKRVKAPAPAQLPPPPPPPPPP
ncbi:MAG: TlpA disulfide reductase family protein [Candidatus Bathyarchaeia archaeon]